MSHRESLRDIEVNLNSQGEQLYHMGLRGRIARSTLADANETRDFRIYRDFAYSLIHLATELYQDEPLPVDIQHELYALGSTTTDLCLSLFPWARFRKTKAAIKLHTLLDLKGSIPTFIAVSDGKTHDVKLMDRVPTPPDAIQVMDRGYLDFARLYPIHLIPAYFITRAKTHLRFRRIRSLPATGRQKHGVRCDQIIMLTGTCSGTILRSRAQQTPGFPHPQLCDRRYYRSRYLSLSLAGRIVLQMDQRPPSDPSLLWHLAQCSQNPNLDRDPCVPVGAYREKAIESPNPLTHFSANSRG
jgi:hypothetical protein